jgi:hypothetical protein
VLSFAPNFQGIEFFKVNELISHYKQHSALNSNEGFIDFLLEHYGNAKKHDSNDHKNLPFKSVSNAATVFINLPELIDVTHITQASLSEKKRLTSNYKQSFSLTNFKPIWHPPQLS